MDKVLVERPRRGGCGKERIRQNRRAAKADPENAEQFRSMTKIHSSKGYDDRKELNENLKPLRRFLRSRVGQYWDKVYSEIMAGLNMKNAAQYHVWQHLIQLGEVQTKTYMQGNTVMVANGYDPYSVGGRGFGREEFYVHPKTGTLCVTERIPKSSYRYNRNEPNPDVYIEPEDRFTQYHRIEGIWYEMKFRESTRTEKSLGYGDLTRVDSGKHQLSTKEIRWVEEAIYQRDRGKKAA